MDVNGAEQALGAGDAASLCAALAGLCEADPDIERLEELVAFALNSSESRPDFGGIADIFLASIEQARQPHHPVIGRRVIGRDLDFLGELDGQETWTAAQWLNLLMLGRIAPQRRAAVVGTMRDDGIYVLEWIAHYLALGFEHIFIYTNDNADGSECLLRQLAALGVITLIESETSGTVRPEVKAFNHAVHLLLELRDYEWILFVDSDEFFVPAPRYDHAIGNVLDALERRYPDHTAAAIAYQWLWFNSAMVFGRRPGLLTERFQYATPHWLVKSLVRLPDVLSMRLQHIPELKPGRFIVNSGFEPLDTSRAWQVWPMQYVGGQINHYWPKSFEEFALKKARGETLRLADNEYLRDFRLFFDWNGPETAETHNPVDAGFLAKVREKITTLRALDGVAAAEADVERGFRRLLARYNKAGGLRQIYDTVGS